MTRTWKQQDIELLTEMDKNGLGVSEIGNVLGRSAHAVYLKLSGLKVTDTSRTGYYWTDEDDRLMIEQYLNYVPVEVIAQNLKRTFATVRLRLHMKGAKRSNSKFNLHHRYGIPLADMEGLSQEELTKKLFAFKAEAASARKADMHHKINVALDLMVKSIVEGVDRREAILKAVSMGASLEDVGKRLGFTREWARQLLHGITPKNADKSSKPLERNCLSCGKTFLSIRMRRYCDSCTKPNKRSKNASIVLIPYGVRK